jgi:hypothetical protein
MMRYLFSIRDNCFIFQGKFYRIFDELKKNEIKFESIIYFDSQYLLGYFYRILLDNSLLVIE